VILENKTQQENGEQDEEQDEEQHEETQTDQWREVYDDRTGRTYYYNRRTRESRWILPKNSIVVGRRLQVSSQSDRNQTTCSEYSLRDVTMSEISSNEHRYNNSGCSFDNDFLCFGEETVNRCGESITTRTPPSLHHANILKQDKHSYEKAVQGTPVTWDSPRNFPLVGHDEMNHNKENKLEHSSTNARGRNTRCFYCMYCGTEIVTANAMKQHIHLSCLEYSYVKRVDPQEHYSLQQILNNIWYCDDGSSYIHESNKENHDPSFLQQQQQNKQTKQADIEAYHKNLTQSSGGLATSQIHNNSQQIANFNSSMVSSTTNSSMNDRSFRTHHTDSVFTLSDEEDTVLDINFHRKYLSQSKDKRTNRKGGGNTSSSSSPPPPPSVCSSCAFCGKVFDSGDKLSRHLLNCKERQRSNKKRTPQKKPDCFNVARKHIKRGRQPASSGMMNNSIQSHLLTCNGRHLPGYPPVAN
jgi:hypothetical protein